MLRLGDIPKIADNIKGAPFKVIKLCNKVIFENEGDRTCRKRVREFTGFTFERGSEEYKTKLAYVANNFSANDVASISNIININYNVKKVELIENICTSLMNLKLLKEMSENGNNTEEEEDDESEEDQEDEKTEEVEEDINSVAGFTSSRRQDDIHSVSGSTSSRPPIFAMNFRDVEDSIRTFTGSSTYPVEKWIADFEDMSHLLSWGELHTFIFAKKSLRGLAKLYIQSESGINSWKALKASLLKEFSSKISSAQLHDMLRKRKMKNEETVHEYFLEMKNLANRGNIESDSLIRYVINGIDDNTSSKLILYGAMNVEDFKKKLQIYNEVKSNVEREIKTQKSVISKEETKVKSNKPIRCYNCGKQGHKSNECRQKDQGTKCFKCNGYGHKSFECKSKSNTHSSTNVGCVREHATNKMYKFVELNGKKIETLIDTGSHVNVIKKNIYELIGAPELNKSDLILKGFGKSKVKTMGHFQGLVRIDDHAFHSTFYVVSNDAMDKSGIIGNELLNEAEVIISQDGIKITKRQHDVSIMNINLQDEFEINIGEGVSKEAKEEVTNLILNFQSNKTKTTNHSMKIVVKTEEPISHNPRRLPFTERDIVDKQVDEWLKEDIIEPSISEYSSQVVIAKQKNVNEKLKVQRRFEEDNAELKNQLEAEISNKEREIAIRIDAYVSEHGYRLQELQHENEKLRRDHQIALEILREENDSIREQLDEKLNMIDDLKKLGFVKQKLKNEYAKKARNFDEKPIIVYDEITVLKEEEMKINFEESRNELKKEAKKNIVKIQEENKKYYNLRRREPNHYRVNDIVAIKRTQFGPGCKLKSKFIGPYKVSRVKANNSYDVIKDGFHEGPNRTTSCAEYMKPWVQEEELSSEADDSQEGRVVGS